MPLAFPFALLAVALAAFILVGHGCHGDDVDHEPSAAPSKPFERPDRPPP